MPAVAVSLTISRDRILGVRFQGDQSALIVQFYTQFISFLKFSLRIENSIIISSSAKFEKLCARVPFLSE